MKKPALIVMICIAAATLILLIGVFIGRNSLTVPPLPETLAATEHDLLNINTADLNRLQELPGIGEVLAQRIIDYRNAHGSFTSLQQLMDIEGIDRGKFDRILELICLED